MKRKKSKILAAKILLSVAIAFFISKPAFATDAFTPLIWSDSLIQTAKQAEEYAKQLEQYLLQVKEYENMVQNTVAPYAYVWNKATQTMDLIRGDIDTLSAYKNGTGDLTSYLNKFQDASYYRNSPCFKSGGCSDAEMAELNSHIGFGSETQKKSNDALFKVLDRQQEALGADAAMLETIQASAQTAKGQMESLGYANQLASFQANQLLQMNALMIARQNIDATRNQALMDREAMQDAAHAHFYSVGTFKPTTEKWVY